MPINHVNCDETMEKMNWKYRIFAPSIVNEYFSLKISFTLIFYNQLESTLPFSEEILRKIHSNIFQIQKTSKEFPKISLISYSANKSQVCDR